MGAERGSVTSDQRKVGQACWWLERWLERRLERAQDEGQLEYGRRAVEVEEVDAAVEHCQHLFDLPAEGRGRRSPLRLWEGGTGRNHPLMQQGRK